MGLIDLGDLASGYAYRPPTEVSLRRARAAAVGQSGLLLDVGGGTGAHAATWVGERRTPIVVDPAPAMCAMSAEHRGVEVVCGRSQELPFTDASAGLVYFHLSIHYGSFRDAIDEACRVAEEGARIEIWTFAPESMASTALATWFPTIAQLDADRFPQVGAIENRLAKRGADVEVQPMPEVVERSAGSWNEAVRHRFVSTLQLLSQAEIEEGLARFTVLYPDSSDVYRYTIDFVRIRATR